jgi:hypothetical protein
MQLTVPFAPGVLFKSIVASTALVERSKPYAEFAVHMQVPGSSIVSVESTKRLNFTVPMFPQLLPEPVSGFSVVEIKVTLTHSMLMTKLSSKHGCLWRTGTPLRRYWRN